MQVLGIGPNVPFSQKSFATSLELSYPLLSDFPELSTSRNYGVLRKSNEQYAHLGYPLRAFFLIDKEGIIRGRWLPGVKGDDIVVPSESILKVARELSKKL